MKTSKNFQVGDKVFAKVKGYPAWPAKIIGESGKKYNVRFYGTKETGTIKVEDLFHYVQHKEQFNKPLRRKDFREAIEEIERDIQNGGSEEKKEEDTNVEVPAVKKTSKRSLPSDSENNVALKKRRRSSVSSDKAEPQCDNETTTDNEVTESENKPLSDSESNKTADEPCKKATSKTLAEKDILINFSKPNQEKKYVIVNSEHLHGVIAYAEHVKKNATLFEKKPVDPRPPNEEILVAKLPSGKLVGIKCSLAPPPDCKTEHEMAQHEASLAKDVLAFKKDLEDGKKTPENDEGDFTVYPLDISENDVHTAIKNRLLDGKMSKLHWLKIESNLLQYDSKIKAALALDKANPREALEYMQLMYKLDVDPLMLRKHPHVMDMVKRLRRYVGNVEEWDMRGDELQEFLKDAQVIRKKAEEVYLKFRDFFDISADNFWDGFTELVEDFKKQTKDLTESQIFSLRFEPNTKSAFLDQYQEMQEQKHNESSEKSKIVENKDEKENIHKEDNSPADVKKEDLASEDAS